MGQRDEPARRARKPQAVSTDETFRIESVWYRVKAIEVSSKCWAYEAYVGCAGGWKQLKRSEKQKHHATQHYAAIFQGKRWVRSYHVAQSGRRRG